MEFGGELVETMGKRRRGGGVLEGKRGVGVDDLFERLVWSRHEQRRPLIKEHRVKQGVERGHGAEPFGFPVFCLTGSFLLVFVIFCIFLFCRGQAKQKGIKNVEQIGMGGM